MAIGLGELHGSDREQLLLLLASTEDGEVHFDAGCGEVMLTWDVPQEVCEIPLVRALIDEGFQRDQSAMRNDTMQHAVQEQRHVHSGLVNTPLYKEPPANLQSMAGETRSVKWTVRLIEDVFTQLFKAVLDGYHEVRGNLYRFIFCYFSHRFGLDSIVETMLADLVCNAQRYFHISTICELFVTFLTAPATTQLDVRFFVIARHHTFPLCVSENRAVDANDGKRHVVPRRFVPFVHVAPVIKRMLYKHPQASTVKAKLAAWLEEADAQDNPRAFVKPDHVDCYELLRFILSVYSQPPSPPPKHTIQQHPKPRLPRPSACTSDADSEECSACAGQVSYPDPVSGSVTAVCRRCFRVLPAAGGDWAAASGSGYGYQEADEAGGGVQMLGSTQHPERRCCPGRGAAPKAGAPAGGPQGRGCPADRRVRTENLAQAVRSRAAGDFPRAALAPTAVNTARGGAPQRERQRQQQQQQQKQEQQQQQRHRRQQQDNRQQQHQQQHQKQQHLQHQQQEEEQQLRQGKQQHQQHHHHHHHHQQQDHDQQQQQHHHHQQQDHQRQQQQERQQQQYPQQQQQQHHHHQQQERQQQQYPQQQQQQHHHHQQQERQQQQYPQQQQQHQDDVRRDRNHGCKAGAKSQPPPGPAGRHASPSDDAGASERADHHQPPPANNNTNNNSEPAHAPCSRRPAPGRSPCTERPPDGRHPTTTTATTTMEPGSGKPPSAGPVAGAWLRGSGGLIHAAPPPAEAAAAGGPTPAPSLERDEGRDSRSCSARPRGADSAQGVHPPLHGVRSHATSHEATNQSAHGIRAHSRSVASDPGINPRAYEAHASSASTHEASREMTNQSMHDIRAHSRSFDSDPGINSWAYDGQPSTNSHETTDQSAPDIRTRSRSVESEPGINPRAYEGQASGSTHEKSGNRVHPRSIEPRQHGVGSTRRREGEATVGTQHAMYAAFVVSSHSQLCASAGHTPGHTQLRSQDSAGDPSGSSLSCSRLGPASPADSAAAEGEEEEQEEEEEVGADWQHSCEASTVLHGDGRSARQQHPDLGGAGEDLRTDDAGARAWETCENPQQQTAAGWRRHADLGPEAHSRGGGKNLREGGGDAEARAWGTYDNPQQQAAAGWRHADLDPEAHSREASENQREDWRDEDRGGRDVDARTWPDENLKQPAAGGQSRGPSKNLRAETWPDEYPRQAPAGLADSGPEAHSWHSEPAGGHEHTGTVHPPPQERGDTSRAVPTPGNHTGSGDPGRLRDLHAKLQKCKMRSQPPPADRPDEQEHHRPHTSNPAHASTEPAASECGAFLDASFPHGKSDRSFLAASAASSGNQARVEDRSPLSPPVESRAGRRTPPEGAKKPASGRSIFSQRCDEAEMDSVPAELLGEGGITVQPETYSRASSFIDPAPGGEPMTTDEKSFLHSLSTALLVGKSSDSDLDATEDLDFAPQDPTRPCLSGERAHLTSLERIAMSTSF
ncbi:hypothetical protein DIPPA_02759 [Diplonema papillatum]|nr:hypothetical protein DIPPA_02759 [Diplonema papillatum]